MIYQKGDIKIRPFFENDLVGNYLIWMNDPIVNQFNSHGLFARTKKEIQRFIDSLDSKDKIVWAILFKEKHIGNVSLQSINWIYRSGEIAIVIGEHKHYGKGIGTTVCQFVLNHGFKKLGLHRIWSGTARPNVGMQKVFEKLGMEFEGTFREAVFLHGKWEDVVCYGITSGEWNEKSI